MRTVAFIAGLLALSHVSAAYAVSIKNLTDQDQAVVVIQSGERQDATLRPGEKRYWYGANLQIETRNGNRMQVSDPLNEYGVWKDGISIQRRPSSRTGAF